MKTTVIHSIFKRSLPLFFALLVAFSSIPPYTTVNAKTLAVESESEQKAIGGYAVSANTDAPYGYTMLSKETNGAAMQRLYESMESAVSKYINGGEDVPADTPWSSSGGLFYELPSASFKGADFGLSTNEMVSVYYTFRADHPEIVFLSSTYLFSESANIIYLTIPEEFVLQSERVKYAKLASERLEDFKNSLDSDDSDYDIAIKAHDLLMEENFYRYDSESIPSAKHSAHSIIGWLDGSGVVCEGYSKAFQYLLKGCGVECLYVTGTSKGQAHAWNMIKCGTSWLWVDATFNDQSNLPGGYYHYYFGLPNTAFLSDHTPADRTLGTAYQVELPAVSDDFEGFYYQKTNALISDSSQLLNILANSARLEFDNSSYTVTLFAKDSEVKTQAISALRQANNVIAMLDEYDLSLRCSTKYSYSTVSAADAGNGGCIIYVNFNYHPCDVDRNTFVEKYDAELILDALCENIPMPRYADTNENGEVTVYDAVLVLKTIK